MAFEYWPCLHSRLIALCETRAIIIIFQANNKHTHFDRPPRLAISRLADPNKTFDCIPLPAHTHNADSGGGRRSRQKHSNRMAAEAPRQYVPLTCHGHSRPVPHINFSSTFEQENYFMLSACKGVFTLVTSPARLRIG